MLAGTSVLARGGLSRAGSAGIYLQTISRSGEAIEELMSWLKLEKKDRARCIRIVL